MNIRLLLLVCVGFLGGLHAAVGAESAKQPKPDAAPAEAAEDAGPAKADSEKADPEKTAPEKAAPEKAVPDKPKPEPAKPEPGATHTVRRTPLRITVELDGIFEARSASEIILRFDEYTPSPPLTVRSAVKHGARVKKGDELLALDAERLDRMIDDLKTELKLAELGLEQAEQSLMALEKTTPIDLAANERMAQSNQEDRQYYFNIQRPFDTKVAEFNLTRARNFLEYYEEELRQLERMYLADEITEETEAIVLRRARDQLESAKMSVEASQISRDFALEFAIPRADERIKEANQRRQLDAERARIALPQALQRQQIDVERQRVQNRRNAERLKKLQDDREQLVVRAPLDGIVYFGKSTRGRFGDAQPLIESLRPGGTVQINQVLMTVVQPQAMTIRATVPENQLHRLRRGLSGVAVPAGFPDLELPTALTQWSEIPTGPGNFDATLRVSLDKSDQPLMPGMACKVKLTPYAKKNALAVPANVVKTDEFDDRRYVYLVGKDGKPAKRDVTIGQRTDKLLEITAGLAEGDKVLVEAPKEDK